MSTIESLNASTQLAAVRLVAASNQSGTYNNGPLNNGVGATFTYATGALTIDSVAVNLNDFILFSGQSSAYQNGIYQCIQAGATGVAAILQRRGDFQCREQIRGGQFVPVSAGTTYGGSVWTVVEPLPAALGAPASGTANNINFTTITAGGSSLFLQVANNLSDLASASTAVTNLGFSQAANKYAFTSFASPDAISDLVWQDISCGQAALASGGSVTIQASSGSKQYKVRNILMNYSASGLSGGGGDRLLQVTDGTTSYNNAGITAALLGTPVNTVWGGSGNPLPGTVAMNTSTAAGAALVAKYAGGTTDYTAGAVVISVLVQRVA
jgi:hypothetical protein